VLSGLLDEYRSAREERFASTSRRLADLVVRCECGKSRSLHEATVLELNPLNTCCGARPWLGRNANEDCKLPSRLLIRTAASAYFPQVMSVLSLPERGTVVQTAVAELWDDLQIVDGPGRPRVPGHLDRVQVGSGGRSPSPPRSPGRQMVMSRPLLAFPVGPARRYTELPGRVRLPSQALQSW
jgi:hypothetical protein